MASSFSRSKVSASASAAQPVSQAGTVAPTLTDESGDEVPASQRLHLFYQGIRELATILGNASDPLAAQAAALAVVAELLQTDYALIFYHDKVNNQLATLAPVFSDRANSEVVQTELETIHLNLTMELPVVQAFNGEQPVFANDWPLMPTGFNQLKPRNMLAVPLKVKGQVQGVCCVVNKTDGDFTEQDGRDLEELAGLLATLLKDRQSARQLEQEQRRHQAVLDAAVDGFVEVNRDMQITVFSKGAEELTGWQAEEVIGKHCHEVLLPHSPENEALCNSCPLRRSFRSGTTVSNVETLIRNRDGEDSWVSCSYNSVTDERGQIVSGIIALKDIFRLKALSDELRQQAQQQESLLGVNNAINGLSNLEEIYRVSLEQISHSITFDLGTIHSLNPDNAELSLMALLQREAEKTPVALTVIHTGEGGYGGQGLGLEDEELQRQARLRQHRASPTQFYRALDGKKYSLQLQRHHAHECEALRENEPYMAVNLPGKEICPVITEFSAMQSHICVPIKTQERSYGVLHLASAKPYAFWGSDFVLALSICKQIAVAAERARLFEQVDRLARTDPLTGLYNKRELWERLDREIRRAERRHSPLSLVLIDLDRLKWINDCFGHSQGDLLLTRLSEIIRQQCRASDVAFRYGGDELCILMPDTNRDEAKIAADRLRKAAREIHLGNETDQIIIGNDTLVTMSIGIAAYPADAYSAAQLFESADAAMYRAKETGKDRTVIFDRQIDFNRLNYRRRIAPTGTATDDRLTPPRQGTGALPPVS